MFYSQTQIHVYIIKILTYISPACDINFCVKLNSVWQGFFLFPFIYSIVYCLRISAQHLTLTVSSIVTHLITSYEFDIPLYGQVVRIYISILYAMITQLLCICICDEFFFPKYVYYLRCLLDKLINLELTHI